MANPYHDSSGKFCSEEQMIGEIRAALNSGNVDLYFTMRTDYEAIKRQNQPGVSTSLISDLLAGKADLDLTDEVVHKSKEELLEEMKVGSFYELADADRSVYLKTILNKSNVEDTFKLLTEVELDDDEIKEVIAHQLANMDEPYFSKNLRLSDLYEQHKDRLSDPVKFQLMAEAEEHVGVNVAQDTSIELDTRVDMMNVVSPVTVGRLLDSMNEDEIWNPDVQAMITNMYEGNTGYFNKYGDAVDLDTAELVDRYTVFARFSDDIKEQSNLVAMLDQARSVSLRNTGDDYLYRRVATSLMDNPNSSKHVVERIVASLVDEANPVAANVYPAQDGKYVSEVTAFLSSQQLGEPVNMYRLDFLNNAAGWIVNPPGGGSGWYDMASKTVGSMLSSEYKTFKEVPGGDASLEAFERIASRSFADSEKAKQRVYDTLLQVDSTPDGFKNLLKDIKQSRKTNSFSRLRELNNRLVSVVNRIRLLDRLEAIKNN